MTMNTFMSLIFITILLLINSDAIKLSEYYSNQDLIWFLESTKYSQDEQESYLSHTRETRIQLDEASSDSNGIVLHPKERIQLIPDGHRWIISGYECGYQICSISCVKRSDCLMRCRCRQLNEFINSPFTPSCQTTHERLCKKFCYIKHLQ